MIEHTASSNEEEHITNDTEAETADATTDTDTDTDTTPSASTEDTVPLKQIEQEGAPVRVAEGETAPLTMPDGEAAAWNQHLAPFSDHAPPLSQGLAAAAMRHIGQERETNQDNVFALVTTLPTEETSLQVGLFAVADGMGGHEGGDIASRLAIRAVVYHILNHFVLPTLNNNTMEDMQSLLVMAVQEANRAIWEYAEKAGSDMGSTCTAALIIGHAIYIAHVGDSRLYLLEGETLEAATTDHSAVGRLIELGHLEPSASREHPLRNQLYRAIGQQPRVEVDFLYQPLGACTHVLLCSDGLWGMASEEEMAVILRENSIPQNACQQLIECANAHGGEDNISVVVVALPIEEEETSSPDST
jgi:serine/threonine protein phosphatase PrpC